MYSNVVYASLWKAMNGFSESIVEDVPNRNTPPSWTVLLPPPLPDPPPPRSGLRPRPPPEPPRQGARARPVAATTSRPAGLCVRSRLIDSPIRRYFLNQRLRCVIRT